MKKHSDKYVVDTDSGDTMRVVEPNEVYTDAEELHNRFKADDKLVVIDKLVAAEQQIKVLKELLASVPFKIYDPDGEFIMLELKPELQQKIKQVLKTK